MLDSQFEPVGFNPADPHVVDTASPVPQTPGKVRPNAGDRSRAQLLEQLHRCPTQQQAISLVGQFITKQDHLTACWLFEQEAGSQAKVVSMLDQEADALLETEPSISKVCNLTMGTDKSIQLACQSLDQTVAIAVPLSPEKPAAEEQKTGQLLCGLASSCTTEAVANAQAQLEAAANYLLYWRVVSNFRQSECFSRFASQIIAVVQKMSDKRNCVAANMVLVNALQDMLGCQRVISVTTDTAGTKHTLQAISGTDTFDSKSPLANIVRQVCATAPNPQESFTWLSDSQDASQHEHFQQLAEQISADCIVTIPTFDGQQSQNGSLIIAGQKKLASQPETFYARKLLGDLVGSQFTHLHTNKRSIGRLFSGMMQFVRGRVGMICLAVMFAATVTMLIPIQYRIPCDCVVQPVTRRFVAAPFDGKLEKTFVEVGDIVEAGQLLARLDGMEIRMELSSLQASYQRESKRHDSSLAARDIADSQIARHEMNRISLDIELLRKRIANLDIVSPAAGVVVAGDLKKVEGSPLKIGQSMFEIAPLERMYIEVLVPETQASYVEKDMEVSLRTDALPFQKLAGNVHRIHPRSEMRNDESVFVAEFELENEDGQLRPGMNGTAKITTGRRTIGWILFHRAWEKAMFQFGI